MNLHKMIEICLKDDNMYIFLMINALICINNYVITCINSMLSVVMAGCQLGRQPAATSAVEEVKLENSATAEELALVDEIAATK